MPLEESGFILATLFIALIALLLVLAARRDAKIIRSQAIRESENIREEILEKRSELLKKSESLDQREQHLENRNHSLLTKESEIFETLERAVVREREVVSELENLAGLNEVAAREMLIARLENNEEQYVHEAIRKRTARAQKESAQEAKRILIDALSRLAVPTSSEHVIDMFELESEDLKGRIIGKEGRNIRSFETVAGVNLIIEADSNAIKVSSFDAERRNVAVTALEALLKGGLVTPGRIEAEVAKAQSTVTDRMREAGFEALKVAGISSMDAQLVELLGKLKFRMSYGQNVLEHSIETSLIAGMLADEVGADSALARRAGLLHDIGKALTPAQRGSHASLGAKFASDRGESQEVANAIAAHHGEVEPESLEAALVKIADAISAARPGVRNEDPSSYISRMEHIERELSNQFGVKSATVYAAGHQIRVVVESSAVLDHQLDSFVDDLANHLENTVMIPGEMEITVIREHRTTKRIG